MQVTTDREQWVTIKEFPNYQISNRGEVFNVRRNRLMRTYLNNKGHLRITLTDFNGERYDRSVPKLVADAFVEKPNPLCRHIIVLDGNFSNAWADNLAWRPVGFAWKYTHQLKVAQPLWMHNLPVRNVTTGAEYENIIHAGVTEGLIFQDIWESTFKKWETYPDGSVFEVIA